MLILPMIILLYSYFLYPVQTNAATIVKGTFVDVSYENVSLPNGAIDKRIKTITIQNSSGKTTTLNIDKYASLSINSTSTTIDAFKLGMKVEADVNLRKVKALRGFIDVSQENTDAIGKSIAGTINKIDKKGTFISIRLDNGISKTFYINNETEFYKDTNLVDLSLLYEGDRVKLKIEEHNSNILTSVEVITQGAIIENLYKGTIKQIDPIQNKLIVKDEQVFRDWKWQSQIPVGNSSKTYSTKTPIFVGNKQIEQDQLRYYANDEVYYVTVSQFDKEIIQKIVIKRTNERTYYEPMTSINTTTKKIGLKNIGIVPYHDGSIIIRNGRLVDSYSLQSSGTAFVVTDGTNTSQYANIVHVTNDGFQSPNLAEHDVYYGKISSAGTYNITINNAKKLSNNYWTTAPITSLTMSNDTNVVEDFRRSTISVVPRNEMDERIGQYGYFYVQDNQIVAAHIVGTSTNIAQLVSVGRLESSAHGTTLRVQNVSHWYQGIWKEAGKIYSMNVEQATIIKDGKVITIDELEPNDRLFIIHESVVKGRIILVN